MRKGSSINPKQEKNSSSDLQPLYSLILFNDDVNIYDFVIDSLVEVCKHNRLQAEQCTLIAHHKGKCDVKSGSIGELTPMKEELISRGLISTIVINS